MSFESATARMREKTLRQLQKTTTKQLEEETKTMEERIRSLKLQLSKEKQQRERQSQGGGHWKSGRAGTLSGYTQEVKTKKKTPSEKGVKKIKVLSDQPISQYIVKPPPVQEKPLPEQSEGEKSRTCGQCEELPASKVCVDCGENYCKGCFNKFHQKGALKKHRSREFVPGKDERILSGSVSQRHSARRLVEQENHKPASSQVHQPATGGSLLEGTYNEEESAASFAAALAEWRQQRAMEKNGIQENNNNRTNNNNKEFSCGTNTEDERKKAQTPDIKFSSTSSLSYLEKLALKQLKQDPVGFVNNDNCIVGNDLQHHGETTWYGKDSSNAKIASNAKIGVIQEENLEARDMFQAFMQHTKDGRKSQSLIRENRFAFASTPIEITEVTDDDDVIEEDSSSSYNVVEQPETREIRRPSSIASTVHIQDFLGEINVCDVEMRSLSVSSAISRSSPFDRNYSRQSHEKSPVHEKTSSRTDKHPSLSSYGKKGASQIKDNTKKVVNKSRNDNLKAMTANYKDPASQNNWKPAPVYSSGISEFLLWGLKEEDKVKEEGDRVPSASSEYDRIKNAQFLNNNNAVWRPTESMTPVPADIHMGIQKPSDETLRDSLDEDFPMEQKADPSPKNNNLYDFGYEDYLTRSPVPSKTCEDYEKVHRVSAKSSIPLEANPPLSWGDDESEEELAELSGSRASGANDLDEVDQHLLEEEDEDGRATIDHLAWELASMQEGRQSQCDFELEEDGMRDGEDSDSSIVDDDAGSGLSSDDMEYLYDDDMMDEDEYDEQQKRLLEEEVHALK